MMLLDNALKSEILHIKYEISKVRSVVAYGSLYRIWIHPK